MTSDDPIIEKIRALLAKTTAAGATEEEAAAAAAAAERLLAKYKLDESDIRASPIVMKKTGLRYMDPWVWHLVIYTSRFYGCTAMVYDQDYKNQRGVWSKYESALVIGRESSASVAVSMIDYLWNTVVRMSRQKYKERKPQLAYQRGMGESLATRLCRMHERQRDQAMAESSGVSAAAPDGTSLIVIEQNEAEEWMRKNLEFSTTTVKSNLESDAALEGWVDAKSIHLGPQVGGAGGGVLTLPS